MIAHCLRALVLSLLWLSPALAAATAQHIEFGPYFSGGNLQGAMKVYHYAAGTTTLQNCWTDRAKSATVAQPVVADSQGIARMWCDGVYKFEVRTAGDIVLYTIDNVAVVDAFPIPYGEGSTITAASTLTLGAAGTFFNVTGGSPISAISGAQDHVILYFQNSIDLIHSSSLALSGSLDTHVFSKTVMGFVNDGGGVWREMFRTNAYTQFGMPGGHIYGCKLSNNVTDATNDIDIAVCEAANGRDSDADNLWDQRVTLRAGAMTKQLDATWVAGSGQGCRNPSESLANGTWHIFIFRTATGGHDYYCSQFTNVSSPSGNASEVRRIGSILREAGAIVAFSQDGDRFYRVTAVRDVNVTNPGTAAALRTLSVPSGIKVEVFGMIQFNSGTDGTFELIYLSSPDQSDQTTAGGQPIAQTGASNNFVGWTNFQLRTDTQSQIRTRITSGTSDGGTTLVIFTMGWVDRRGRDRAD